MADPTPTPPPAPGAGGWVPTQAQRVGLTLVLAAIGAALPLLSADVINWKAAGLASLSALLAGLTGFLGISSAGPRVPGAP